MNLEFYASKNCHLRIKVKFKKVFIKTKLEILNKEFLKDVLQVEGKFSRRKFDTYKEMLTKINNIIKI